MKYMLLVQGEGRGHMTQAIALSQMLTQNGHEIVHTFIGKSDRRVVPQYFVESIPSPVEKIESPNFILDAHNKGLKLGSTILHNALRLNTYRKSLRKIHRAVTEKKPDVFINFYDFLGGFYFRAHRPDNVKHVCVGRQFLTRHPSFIHAQGRPVEKHLFLINTILTSQRCDKFLALSFQPYEPLTKGKVIVAPPLLNPEIKKRPVSHENYLLGYMVNDGYAEEIIHWHRHHRQQETHIFWDRKNMPEVYSPHENITFHQLDSALFSEMLCRCKAYFSTAGFESVCEAMYLQKPVLMVPVKNQYEQQCNAIDAVKNGAGIMSDSFDISLLLDFTKRYRPDGRFRKWEEKAGHIFMEALTNF